MMLKLNLGCGLTIADGWINYDNSPNAWISKYPFLKKILNKTGLISDLHYSVDWSRNIIIRDLRKPLPYDNDKVDIVFTSHFMEHVSQEDFMKLLSELYRVLKPGVGLLRIVLPDLNHYIERYIHMRVSEPYSASDSFMESIRVISKSRDPHLWMYDSASVKHKLSQTGFVEIADCDFRQGNCPDLDILDNRPEDSFWIEARKPK